MSIGERLKEERERLGFSQEAVAVICGTTRKSQFEYEAGRTQPKAGYLEVFARHGADVLYVLTGQRSAPVAPADPGEQVLLQAYRAAPVAQRTAMLGAVVGIAGGAGMAGPADVMPKAKKVKLGDGAVMVGSAGGSVNIRR